MQRPAFMTSLLLAILGGAHQPLSGQALRADEIARAQADKAAHLGVEGASIMERIFVRASAFGFDGPYPWAGEVYPGTGVGFGVGYAKPWDSGLHLNLLAGASVNGSRLVSGDLQWSGLARDRVVLSVGLRHASADDLSFFGLGPGSPRRDPLKYDFQLTSASGRVGYRPARHIELAVKYAWVVPRDDLERRPPAGAAGFNQHLWYHVLTAAVLLDWRDAPGYSTRGGSHRVIWSQYLEARGRPFGFRQFEYEGTQLISLLHSQYVLAFRALATLTTPTGQGAIPAFLEPTLGGAYTLRGYPTRRFTGAHRLALGAEYRWRPSRWIDMALFGDAGNVAGSRRRLRLSHLKSDWGVGLRIHTLTSTLVRLELARGDEGWQSILAVGAPF